MKKTAQAEGTIVLIIERGVADFSVGFILCHNVARYGQAIAAAPNQLKTQRLSVPGSLQLVVTLWRKPWGTNAQKYQVCGARVGNPLAHQRRDGDGVSRADGPGVLPHFGPAIALQDVINFPRLHRVPAGGDARFDAGLGQRYVGVIRLVDELGNVAPFGGGEFGGGQGGEKQLTGI